MRRKTARASQRAFGLTALAALVSGGASPLVHLAVARHMPDVFATSKLYFQHVAGELRAMQAMGHAQSALRNISIDASSSVRHFFGCIRGASLPLQLRVKFAAYAVLGSLIEAVPAMVASQDVLLMHATANALTIDYIKDDASFILRSNVLRVLQRASMLLVGEPSLDETDPRSRVHGPASAAGGAGVEGEEEKNAEHGLAAGTISKQQFLRECSGALGEAFDVSDVSIRHTADSLI